MRWPRLLFAGSLLLVPLLLSSGCSTSSTPSPQVVSDLDLDRYAGTWHEIARLPFWQQEGCWNTTANYELRDDGEVTVTNRCLDGQGGDERIAEGVAWIPDSSEGSKLLVSFFWPFRGDYWVLGVGDDYEWALVGTPSRKYLWVLSRTPKLEEPVYNELVALASAQGYEVDKLLVTPRSED